MKVLITGGAGFIGTRVARRLLQEGHTVSILDNFSPQIHGGRQELPPDLSGQVELTIGDVRDESIWGSVLPGNDAIVHLAAETGTGQSMYEVSRYEQVNLSGTAHLYQWLANHSNHTVSRFVVASSRAIYGEGAYLCAIDGVVYPRSRSTEDKKHGFFDPLCPKCGGICTTTPTPEEAPFQPSSFYGLTKQVQEQMAMIFGETLAIPSFALRYQNVYGPGQSLKNPYTGILAIFSNLARLGDPINVFEDGLESRDFVYIEDVVTATVACVNSSLSGEHVLNIGSNERIDVLTVANAVNAYFGGKSKLSVSGAFRQGDIRHGMADLQRAESLIAYSPKWNFREGLKNFLDWASESDPVNAGYKASLLEMKSRGLLHEK